MNYCHHCKVREATHTCTIDKVGRRSLCKMCHAAIPPGKRTTHMVHKTTMEKP